MGLREAERIVPSYIKNEDVTLRQVRDYCDALLKGLNPDNPKEDDEITRRCSACRFGGVCGERGEDWDLEKISLTQQEIQYCKMLGGTWVGMEDGEVKIFTECPVYDWDEDEFKTDSVAIVVTDLFPSLKHVSDGRTFAVQI